MADATHDFGPVDELKPEAIGIPGQRRFRVVFRRDNRTACFWMEKEQLGALADAIQELLGQIEDGTGPHTPKITGAFPPPYEVEAQTGRLALGFNEHSNLFLILLFDLENEMENQEEAESDEEAEGTGVDLIPSFRCEVSRAQIEKFYNETAVVIQSGRPPRPSKNGHLKAN